MTLILAPVSACSPSEASPRLRTTLSSANVVVAPDAPGASQLMSELGLASVPRTIPGSGSGAAEVDQVIMADEPGSPVVVVLAEPGAATAALVRTAIDRRVPVTVVPGPDPITAALAISGLPSERFCFEGCPPRTPERRRARFAELAGEYRTLVFALEAGERAASITDLATAFGAERQGALCRGLAKTEDQVRRAPLGELGRQIQEDDPEPVLLVVRGASQRPASAPPPARELAAAVEDLVRGGAIPKAAIAAVAERFELRKRTVYDAVIEFKDRG